MSDLLKTYIPTAKVTAALIATVLFTATIINAHNSIKSDIQDIKREVTEVNNSMIRDRWTFQDMTEYDRRKRSGEDVYPIDVVRDRVKGDPKHE